MNFEQIPTAFVALLLAPDQHDLFHEIQAEAIDILDEQLIDHPHFVSGGEHLVLLDRDCMRLALGWSRLPAGDVLTLAVGARPEHNLPEEEAQVATSTLRKLVQRAEALFEVRRSLWQIAMLPLNEHAMDCHAIQLGVMDPNAENFVSTSFITFEPNRDDVPEPSNQPKATDDVLAGIRAAMETSNAEPNWTKQASALALSTAFVLVTPPVGIAMLTYAALRQGKDMDLLPQDLDFASSDGPWGSDQMPLLQRSGR